MQTGLCAGVLLVTCCDASYISEVDALKDQSSHAPSQLLSGVSVRSLGTTVRATIVCPPDESHSSTTDGLEARLQCKDGSRSHLIHWNRATQGTKRFGLIRACEIEVVPAQEENRLLKALLQECQNLQPGPSAAPTVPAA